MYLFQNKFFVQDTSPIGSQFQPRVLFLIKQGNDTAKIAKLMDKSPINCFSFSLLFLTQTKGVVIIPEFSPSKGFYQTHIFGNLQYSIHPQDEKTTHCGPLLLKLKVVSNFTKTKLVEPYKIRKLYAINFSKTEKAGDKTTRAYIIGPSFISPIPQLSV